MSLLLDRETSPVPENVQEDETLPECLRAYQPFVMLWSEKRPEQISREMNWQFTDDSHGMTDLNYSMHETTHLCSDGNGGVLIDCVF